MQTVKKRRMKMNELNEILKSILTVLKKIEKLLSEKNQKEDSSYYVDEDEIDIPF